MIQAESDPQFRDNLFISRLHFTQSFSPPSHTQSTSKMSRSTWTNKIMRQKHNEIHLCRFEEMFQNALPNKKPSFNNPAPPSSNIKVPTKDTQRLTRKQICSRIGHAFGTSRKNSVSATHFSVSRNVYSRQGHENLSKSGILVESVQKEGRQSLQQSYTDPRVFLKNLKIKTNINLYKGNFSKFTKKDVSRRLKVKKCQLTVDSDLSPWEIDKNINYLY